MNLSGWLWLLMSNRFAIDWRFLPSALFITVWTPLNTVLRGIQEVLWGRRLQDTEISPAPLFIIGHWRSGTTLLHEFLTLDERHTFPTTYQCFLPNYFLLTHKRSLRLLDTFFLPPKRPMDNMSLCGESPQEDEFALCNLGELSPYLMIAFPNTSPQYQEYFDLEALSPSAMARWKNNFLKFLKQVGIDDTRRIVLKSPTHTFRIKVLLDLFPDAKFVHIVRNPYFVFPSTVHLWKSLYRNYGLQRPKFLRLDDYVFDNFIRLYEKFEEARPLLHDRNLCEIRYEDLINDPVGQLKKVYDQLDLGDFESVLPKLEQVLAENSGYRTNRYDLTPELRDKITQRWGPVIRRYGYAVEGDEKLSGQSSRLGGHH